MSRELDAQIAERVMGYTNIYLGEHGDMYVETPESAPFRTSAPRWSTDLNACATAEARIISMGLGKQYGIELILACLFGQDDEAVISATRRSLSGDTFFPTAPNYVTTIATASAEARCRAMLATLEGK